MVRQYIGARYVPKFIGEYDATMSYEPLSIVQLGNNFYTSKIPVPPGTPVTNSTYWALTGSYNGALNNLQERIDEAYKKLLPFVTPEEYGAVGDGVTDDTTAVHAAAAAAISQRSILYLTKWYKVSGLDLSDLVTGDETPRIYNLHIAGINPNNSGVYLLNDESLGCGFVSNSLVALKLPITHNMILENFAFRVPEGSYCLEIGGGLETTIRNINFGYYGNGIHLHSGGYYHVEDCAINTRTGHFIYIENTETISDTEYLYVENCAIAHAIETYGDSAIITTGNNFLTLMHCDLIGWENAIEFTGTRNSKAFKIIDTQIGTTYILRNRTSFVGVNGIVITDCNINVEHEYMMFDAVNNGIVGGLVFCNNLIYEVPSLTTKTALFDSNRDKYDWYFYGNSYRLAGPWPPYCDLKRTTSISPANIDRQRIFGTAVNATELASGVTITGNVPFTLANGTPLDFKAYATNINSNVPVPLTIDSIAISGGVMTATVSGTVPAGTYITSVSFA